MESSIFDATTGQVRFDASSTGTLGTNISYFGSVVGGDGSVQVDDNMITVTGLSYNESHTVNVVATSAACPEALSSSTSVVINFDIRSKYMYVYFSQLFNILLHLYRASDDSTYCFC